MAGRGACCFLQRWGKRPIQFWLPREVEDLLEQLMSCHHCIRQPGVLHLFLNASGAPFKSASFCQYWKELQIRHAAGAIMPPRMLRHVFVTSRLENPDLPGPSDEGAAMVMGELLCAGGQLHAPWPGLARGRRLACTHPLNCHIGCPHRSLPI